MNELQWFNQGGHVVFDVISVSSRIPYLDSLWSNPTLQSALVPFTRATKPSVAESSMDVDRNNGTQKYIWRVFSTAIQSLMRSYLNSSRRVKLWPRPIEPLTLPCSVDVVRVRIHPNLKSTVYCSAIAFGGTEEWDFAWRMFQNATVATESARLRAALACTKAPWLLNRCVKTVP